MEFNKIKVIIFDMDGVIVDTEFFHLKNLNNLFQYHGVKVPKNVLIKTAGLDENKSWIMLKEYILEKWDYETYRKMYIKQIINKINYKELLRPNIKETLEELKNRNYKILLASSSKLKQINKILKEIGIMDYFQLILSGEMFLESKPNPEIYIKCAEELKVRPDECLVIEDSEYGIAAAINAGMIVAAYNENRFKLDQSKAHFKINNITEIFEILQK